MASLIHWQDVPEQGVNGEPGGDGSARPAATSSAGPGGGDGGGRGRAAGPKATPMDAAVERLLARLAHEERASIREEEPGIFESWIAANSCLRKGPSGAVAPSTAAHAAHGGDVDEQLAAGTPALSVPFSQWTTIGYIIGWEEAARRMSNEAATFGVLSALLASLTFPTFITPPSFQDRETTCLGIPPSQLENAFGISVFMAIVFAVADVCTGAVTIMQVGACPTETDLMEFMLRFQFMAGINFLFFFLAILCLIVGAWSVLVYRYSLAVVIACSVFVGFVMLSVLVLCYRIYLGFTMAKLQVQHQRLVRMVRQLGAAQSALDTTRQSKPDTQGALPAPAAAGGPGAGAGHHQDKVPEAAVAAGPPVAAAGRKQEPRASVVLPALHDGQQ